MSWRAQHAEQESRGGIRSGHGKQESRGKFDLDKARKRNSLHVCYTVGFFEVRSCLS